MKDSWKVAGARADRQTVTPDWQPTDQQLIDGVQLHQILPVISSDREMTEIIRLDWFEDPPTIEQVFQVTLRTGAISAWHGHAKTTDHLYVAHGVVRIALYDRRPDSPTQGRVNEFTLSTRRPGLLVVPPKVWHGLQNVGEGDALVINSVDYAYCYENPDHWRVSPETSEIPFDFLDRRYRPQD